MLKVWGSALLALCVFCGCVPLTWAQFTPAVHSPVPYATTINVKAAPYNCAADGSTDDTTCLQTALDVFSNVNVTGTIFLPVGDYKITATLTYTGKSATSMSIEGPLSTGRGPQGAVLKWYGSSGGTMVQLKGANSSAVKNLGFDGRTVAAVGLQALYDDAHSIGSSGLRLENLVIGGLTGAESRCIDLGADGTGTQVSEVWMSRLRLVGSGSAGTTYYGIVTGTGNAKNFSIEDTTFIGFRYGLVFGYDSSAPGFQGGSGFLSGRSLYFSSNTVADIHAGVGTFILSGGGSEGSAALLIGTTGGNHGSATIENFYWSGVTDSTDFVIAYSGALHLFGNNFYNGRTGSSEPKVKSAALKTETATGGGIFSQGNMYKQVAGTYPPLYNGSDLLLSGLDATLYNVQAFADMRVDAGGGNFRFLAQLPDDIRPATVAFANLGTVAVAGSMRYCSDCTIANPCASGGSGAIAKRLNGVWVCN